MKICLFGDVHGRPGELIQRYQIQDFDVMVQLGDFGFKDTYYAYLPLFDPGKLKVLGGNHDEYPAMSDPAIAPYFLGDFGLFPGTDDVFFIRGAWSIDKNVRIERGWGWWPEEELTYEQLEECREQYLKIKPRVVIAHTLPADIAVRLISPLFGMNYYNNRTEEALQWMFEQHQPEEWLAGHWHCSYESVDKGTKFRVLNIDESTLIEV